MRNITCIYQSHHQPNPARIPREQQQSQTIISSFDSFPGKSVLLDSGEAFSFCQEDFIFAIGHVSQTPVIFGGQPERGHLSSALISNDPTRSPDFSFMDFSILSPSLWIEPVLRAPRAFLPKPLHYHQLSLNRKYVICAVSSYPQMLLPGKSMPPFMHPQCLVEEPDQEGRVTRSFPEPLAKCAGIVAMWSVKNRNNGVFIWRAIRAEQERLSEEVG
jgi:hypothetical protein